RYRLRSLLASLFGLETEKVVLEPVSLGGDFGGKGAIGHEAIAYLLAKETGRPIRILRSYTEELMAGNPRHGLVIRTKTGVKKDGAIVARDVEIFVDGGAYAAPKASPTLTIPSVMRVMGPYRIPNTRLIANFCYTNTPPGGSMRAPGQPQVVFAGESEIDIIAEALGMDPLEFRLKNVLEDGEEWPNGTKYADVPSRATLEMARDASNWFSPLPKWRGRGMAISERGIGSGATGLEVTLKDDGSVDALNGTPDMGAGAFTVLRQILADQLHVPLEAVMVRTGNTSETLVDSGTGGSKSTYSLSAAAIGCASKLNPLIAELAARRLECAVDDLDTTETAYFVKGSPNRAIPTTDIIAQAAADADEPIMADSPGPEKGAPEISSQVNVAEVEVDPETGQVKLLKVVLANDVGTQINPRLLEGQIDGGALQGIGMALLEDLSNEDGRPNALHLGDYKLPTAADLPELVNVYLEGRPGPLAYQAKAVGEHAVIPMAGAIANAVAAACGVHVRSLPITAEKVLAGLRAKG
ncbi:MAG TPA: molybdopterin cofactor-binding domain-containing protein, partial [Chloroflexota bacterium]|nr:molybdopterin cofactor-binding domain-containing protein [Chloroflexota bacterium]